MKQIDSTWQVTASVWQSWVFPVRNSPKISVMDPVSIPPNYQKYKVYNIHVEWYNSLYIHICLWFLLKKFKKWNFIVQFLMAHDIYTIYSPWRSLSSSFDPVVTWMISDRFWWNSVAVVKPMGTSFAASAYNKVIKVRVTPKLKSVAGYFILVWLQIKMNDNMM